MLSGLKHLDCVSQVGYVSLHGYVCVPDVGGGLLALGVGVRESANPQPSVLPFAGAGPGSAAGAFGAAPRPAPPANFGRFAGGRQGV